MPGYKKIACNCVRCFEKGMGNQLRDIRTVKKHIALHGLHKVILPTKACIIINLVCIILNVKGIILNCATFVSDVLCLSNVLAQECGLYIFRLRLRLRLRPRPILVF